MSERSTPTLLQLRQSIDEVDQQLLRLFEQRLRLAEQIAARKQESPQPLPMTDPKREEAIIQGLSQQTNVPLLQDALPELYNVLTDLSKEARRLLQLQQATKHLPVYTMSTTDQKLTAFVTSYIPQLKVVPTSEEWACFVLFDNTRIELKPASQVDLVLLWGKQTQIEEAAKELPTTQDWLGIELPPETLPFVHRFPQLKVKLTGAVETMAGRWWKEAWDLLEENSNK